MKLSVCIPVYNVAPYIERCARTLFGQTYGDMEYLFVDDGTPDDSMAIVRRVLADYPNRANQVKFLRHDCNRGLVAARKTAMRAATGELIAHCDSDDWLDIDLYERMIARLEATKADVALCSMRRHFGRVREICCPADLDLSGPEAMRMMDSIPLLCDTIVTKVFRRDLVCRDDLEYPESICIAEDYCLMVQVLSRCRRLTSVGGVYYNYRLNANSLTRSREAHCLVDNHKQVYDILTRKVPGDEGVVSRRNLVRAILFWGVTHGLLAKDEFCMWRTRYEQLGGLWDWSDMSLWGQRMMKLADRSFALSRLVSPFARRFVRDFL